MFRFLEWLLGFDSNIEKPQPRSATSSVMNEGDYRSGSTGYSPNKTYPETQYGSGFDEDAQWHEDH